MSILGDDELDASAVKSRLGEMYSFMVKSPEDDDNDELSVIKI